VPSSGRTISWDFGCLVSSTSCKSRLGKVTLIVCRHLAYWLFPGHYVLEGLLTSQYHQDYTPIEASLGTPFYEFLVSNPDSVVDCPVLIPGLAGVCGTAEVWIYTSFGGRFAFEHIPWNVLYLFGLIIGARIVTFVGLANLNYLAK
jgi:hypothetical protein